MTAQRRLFGGPHYFRACARLPGETLLAANEALQRLMLDPRYPGLHNEKLNDAGPADAPIEVRSIRVDIGHRIIHAAEGDRVVALHADSHDSAYRWKDRHLATIPNHVARATPLRVAGEQPPATDAAHEAGAAPEAAPDPLAEASERGLGGYLTAIGREQALLVDLDTAGRGGLTFVKGGAGTGKSAIAIHRAIRHASAPELGYGPVLYLCYNRALAETVRAAIEELAEPAVARRVFAYTFHGWATWSLTRSGEPFGDVDWNGQRLTEAVRRSLPELGAPQREALRGFGARQLAAEIRLVLRPNQFGTVEEYLDLERPRSQGLPPLRRPQREAIWALDALARQPGRHALQPDDLIEAARALRAGDAEAERYQAVIVDEAQDCSPVMARLAKALVAGEERRLMVFADPAQSIYPNGFRWAQREFRPRGAQVRTLRVPYRSTRPIHALAGSLYAGVEEMRREVGELGESSRDGPLPVLVERPDGEEELAFLVRSIRAEIEGGRQPWQIGVLTSTNARRDEARERLAAEDIPAHALDRSAPDGASVTVVTVQSAKGLDFASVYLLDVKPWDGSEEARRAQLYVALTRSSEALTVVCRPGTRSPLLDDLDPERYRTHEGEAA